MFTKDSNVRLPMQKGKGVIKPITIRKSTQRHRVKLNQDIELVKSLSFDHELTDALAQRRSMKLTLENIDKNEEINTKRRKERKRIEQSSTVPQSPIMNEVTFKIKEDSLQHILKIESEKQFEIDLSANTNQLAGLRSDIESINLKIDDYQNQISSLSYEIESLSSYPKYSLNNLNNINNDNPTSNAIMSKKDKKTLFEKMNVLAQGHHARMEKKDSLEKEKSKLMAKIKVEKEKLIELKQKASNAKSRIKEIKNRMRDYYHVLLYKGTDIRQDGLINYIKTIWNMGFDVDLSFMPSFLDKESIDYLFVTARKSIEINALRQKISETKKKHAKQLKNHLNSFQFETRIADCKISSPVNTMMSKYAENNSAQELKYTLRQINAQMNNKRPLDSDILLVFATMNKLSFRLNQLELDMINSREREIKRIAKEYIINDYENRYSVSIETLISALVGETYKDKELNHYSHIRNVRNYN